MSRSENPYPEFLIDEASGIEVPDIRHQIWAEGYQAGKEAVKCPLGLVCYPSCFWWKDGKCTFQEESENPYPEFLIDEASGVKVPDIKHQIWVKGHQAGKEA